MLWNVVTRMGHRVSSRTQLLKVVKMSAESSYSISTTGYTTINNLYPVTFLWDANNYLCSDGVSVYLECYMEGASDATAMAQLATVGGTGVTGSSLSVAGATPALVRSGDIASNLTNGTEYVVQTKIDKSGSSGKIYHARLIIVQKGIIQATETIVPLFCDVQSISATAYTNVPYRAFALWTDGNWNGTVEVFLEAELKAGSGGVLYCQLADTSGNAVSGSQISHNTTTGTRVRSGNIYSGLSNGVEYTVQAKRETSNGTIAYAALVVKQSNSPTKTEVYIPLVAGKKYVYPGPDNLNGWFNLKSSDWNVDSLSWYYEICGYRSTGSATCNNYLQDSSSVTYDNQTFTSINYVRKRSSAALTLPDGLYTVLSVPGSSSAVYVHEARLLGVLAFT